jgi:hypothetical protein
MATAADTPRALNTGPTRMAWTNTYAVARTPPATR